MQEDMSARRVLSSPAASLPCRERARNRCGCPVDSGPSPLRVLTRSFNMFPADHADFPGRKKAVLTLLLRQSCQLFFLPRAS